MAKVKLTKAQLEFLKECAKSRQYAVETYAPVQKLLALGFIEGTDHRTSSPTWTITDAGKAYLDSI